MKYKFGYWLVLIFSLLGSGHSYTKEKVVWIVNDFPPGTILSGEFKGQGITDVYESIVMKHLPEFEHERRVTNIRRAFHLIRNGENACSAGRALSEERAEIAWFSIPSAFVPSQRLITNEENHAEFDKIFNFGHGESSTNDAVNKHFSLVSLNTILEQHAHMKLGIVEGRAYGSKFDPILEKYGDSEHVFKRAGADLGTSILRMLQVNRINYTIEFPFVLQYEVKASGGLASLYSFPLLESSNYLKGYIVCTKNKWGKRMIDKINSVLLKVRPLDEYRDSFERWLDKKSIPEFRRQYKKIFLNSK